MSLQLRLASFISAVGADIKSLQNQITALPHLTNNLTVSSNASPPSSPNSGDLWIVNDVTGVPDDKAPKGSIGTVVSAASTTLAVIGTFVEDTATRIVMPSRTSIRYYEVTINSRFNMGTGGTNGLVETALLATSGTVVGNTGVALLTVVGGGGQVTTSAYYRVTVPAGTTPTFSVQSVRRAGGTASDTMIAATIRVSDDGGP